MWVKMRGRALLGQSVRDAATPQLSSMLSQASPEVRGVLLDMKTKVCAAIIEELDAKLFFYDCCPYSAVASFWGDFFGGDVGEARRETRKNLDEYDAIVAASRGHKLHRVAHRLYSRGCRCRSELDLFASGMGESLISFPTAYAFIKQYCLVPIVSRSIEGAHALLKRSVKRLTHASVPCIAALCREDDNIRKLQNDPEVYRFVLRLWRSRSMLDNILRLVLREEELTDLTRKQKIERVYQCAIEDEFKDMSTQVVLHQQYLENTRHMRSTNANVFTLSWAQAIAFFKCKFAPDNVFSLPTDIFDLATSVSAAIGNQACDKLSEFVDFATASIVEFDFRDVGNVVFFNVVNAHPERRSLVPIQYIDRRTDEICVSKCTVVASILEARTVVVSVDELLVTLRVSVLVALASRVLPCLFKWAVKSRRSTQAFKQPEPDADQDQRSFSDVGSYALPARSSSCLVPVLASNSSASETSSASLARLTLGIGELNVLLGQIRACSVAGWTPATALADVSRATLGELCEIGLLEMRSASGSGHEIRPVESALKWCSMLGLSSPSQVLHLGIGASTCKFDSVLALIKSGWQVGADPSHPFAPGSPRRFVADLLRPASYFKCLLPPRKA